MCYRTRISAPRGLRELTRSGGMRVSVHGFWVPHQGKAPPLSRIMCHLRRERPLPVTKRSVLTISAVVAAFCAVARADTLCLISSGQIIAPGAGGSCDFRLTQTNNPILEGIVVTGTINNTGPATTLDFRLTNNPLIN